MKKVLLIFCFLIPYFVFSQINYPAKDSLGNYGIINSFGKWVVQPKYSSIGEFFDYQYNKIDSATVFVENNYYKNSNIVISKKSGLISEKGKILIKPKYDRLICSKGLCLATDEKETWIIDYQEKKLEKPKENLVYLKDSVIVFTNKENQFFYKKVFSNKIFGPFKNVSFFLTVLKYFFSNLRQIDADACTKLPLIPLGGNGEKNIIMVLSLSCNYCKDTYKNVRLLKFYHPSEYVIKLLKRQLFFKEFWALKDVSFSLKKGEILGIVGFNGSGKSTILKIVAGVLEPTTGSVQVKGKVAPLIELGAGFDPELTARENIFLNGSVLGYSKKFMESKFDEIVEFSELGEFLDTPLKNFSSGMYARLGFAIATVIDPDILIADEILAVGDFHFQEKCEKKIKEMMKQGTSILFVSHSIEQVEQLCDRVIWLEKGTLKMEGSVLEVCEAYRNS